MKDEERKIVDQFENVVERVGKVLNVSIAFNELDNDQKLPALCMMVDSTAKSLGTTSIEILKEMIPAVLFVNETIGDEGII